MPSRTSASIEARNAASVLPEPVGAATSACRPALIAGQASTCAAVGAAKAEENHALTAGWKRSRTSRLMGSLRAGTAPVWPKLYRRPGIERFGSDCQQALRQPTALRFHPKPALPRIDIAACCSKPTLPPYADRRPPADSSLFALSIMP